MSKKCGLAIKNWDFAIKRVVQPTKVAIWQRNILIWGDDGGELRLVDPDSMDCHTSGSLDPWDDEPSMTCLMSHKSVDACSRWSELEWQLSNPQDSWTAVSMFHDHLSLRGRHSTDFGIVRLGADTHIACIIEGKASGPVSSLDL